MKKQLNRFLIALERLYPGIKYFWFIEFQLRGAPHFNIGLTLENPTNSDRLAVATMWAKIVAGEDFDKVVAVNSHPRQWENFRELDGALRYIVSYATKPHQKTVPLDYQDVGRFWGMPRVENPEQPKVAWGSEKDVREYLAAMGRDFDNWELLPKIIFV